MNIPNLISIGRLLLVPLCVYLLVQGAYGPCFAVFVIAGISDAVDGFIAKRFGQTSELGAHLDPLADKALLVAIFGELGFAGYLPAWLVIAAISRDLLIVAAVILSWMLGRPVSMAPARVSKANTAAQIVLAAFVLAELGLGFRAEGVRTALIVLAGGLTLASAGVYMVGWLRHMSVREPA